MAHLTNSQIDTINFIETLDLLSAPLFHDISTRNAENIDLTTRNAENIDLTSQNAENIDLNSQNALSFELKNSDILYKNKEFSMNSYCSDLCVDDKSFLERTDKVFDDLLSRTEMFVENTVNSTSFRSVFDTWPESAYIMSHDQIPVIEEDLDVELESVTCYRAPSPKQYDEPPKTPPCDTPPPGPSEPIPESSPAVMVRQGPVIIKPLTVTCNEEEAVLHPDLLCRGSRGKCILYQGQWLTPNQFEYHTGRAQSKYWKRSIYAMGTPLVSLMREGRLSEHDRSCTCGEMERRDEPKRFTGV